MKEYIAETGGRYTYTDDILNLQELALSMTSIFEGCSNFIISGCQVSGAEVTPGFVWIGGKVRHFEGCKDAKFPYYIYERNIVHSTVYANEVNKKGRYSFLCLGGSKMPQEVDEVTGRLPEGIEVTAEYAPRLIDKFFGRYSLLVDSPFALQTVKRDLKLTGSVAVDKGISSLESLCVGHPEQNSYLKGYVKEDGNPAIGVYRDGLLVNEMVWTGSGAMIFYKDGKAAFNIGENWVWARGASFQELEVGDLEISGSNIWNLADLDEDAGVSINAYNRNSGAIYRNFRVFDGKSSQDGLPLFEVAGKKGVVSAYGLLEVSNSGKGIRLLNTDYLKSDKGLTNVISWLDRQGEVLGLFGYRDQDSFGFVWENKLGSILIAPKDKVDVLGELYVKGVNIAAMFVGQTVFADALKKKVDVVAGKGLSTEDFTGDHRKKLEGIVTSTVASAGSGYVTAKDVSERLTAKLDKSGNLGDVPDKGIARGNLDVYSCGESNGRFLRVSQGLRELVSLTADEVNGLDGDQAAALKAEKQAKVRETLDAEKRGTGELKLSKASNLSDLPDKVAARKNISVYSSAEVDGLLAGKLSVDGAYNGVLFTEEHRRKLEGIKTGSFAGIDSSGVSVSQVEGYVLTSGVVKELAKKANLLLDGYNATQKKTIAGNIGVYLAAEADERFASVSGLLQDYITYQVKQGKTTAQAQGVLRDQLDVLSKEEVISGYVRRDGKLSDLMLADAEAKKLVCRNLGAAYAEEYQPKIVDTGWLQMGNSGSGTDTRQLFIRQIGNVVCIQGIVNTGKRDGTNKGGVVGVIPNQIMPPKYGLRVSYADYNDNHKYNRGASFVIKGNSRKIQIYESGWNNENTEIHFSYMT